MTEQKDMNPVTESVYINLTKPISTWLPGSKLIRWVEKIPFSHGSVTWLNPFIERHEVYEASIGGVKYQSMERFLKHQHLVFQFELKVTKAQKKEIMQKCCDLAGTHYDYLGIIGVAIKKFVKWATGKDIKVPFHDGQKSSFCTEVLGYTVIETLPHLKSLEKEQGEALTTSAIYRLMLKAAEAQPELVKQVL